MQTVTKVKSKISVKQKVAIAVGTLALLAGLGGLLNAMGQARGYGFGWPAVRRPISKSAVTVKQSNEKPTQPSRIQKGLVAETSPSKEEKTVQPQNEPSGSGQTTEIPKTTEEQPATTVSVENCINIIDDDKNGLTDCDDLYCYTRDLAPMNICYGENGQDKVLIVGTNYGFIDSTSIKADYKTNVPYVSGMAACVSAYNKACVYIEQYVANQWQKNTGLNCSDQITQSNFNLNEIYRAVCQGLDAETPDSPIVLPGVIKN